MMKINYLLAVIFSLATLACFAQSNKAENKYYYYKGEKKELKINKHRIVVFFDKNDDIKHFVEHEYRVSRIINPDKKQNPNKKSKNTVGMEVLINDSQKYDSVYHSLKNVKGVKAIGYVIGDSLPVMISNIFYH